jgi:flavorubredoxin
MHDMTLYESKNHILVCLYDNDRDPGGQPRTWGNQYLIKRNNKTILLHPAGLNNMARVLVAIHKYTSLDQISDIIVSNQNPETIQAMASWLMLTKADVHISNVWVKSLQECDITTEIDRIHGIPDGGMNLALDDYYGIQIIPAYFLNSEGHINVYDPESKILFSGIIGSATTNLTGDLFVENFNQHIQHIKPFHQRYTSGIIKLAPRHCEIAKRLKQSTLFK